MLERLGAGNRRKCLVTSENHQKSMKTIEHMENVLISDAFEANHLKNARFSQLFVGFLGRQGLVKEGHEPVRSEALILRTELGLGGRHTTEVGIVILRGHHLRLLIAYKTAAPFFGPKGLVVARVAACNAWRYRSSAPSSCFSSRLEPF